MAGAKAESNMELDPKYDNFNFPITAVENRSGYSGHLNASQQAQISQLRMMLEAAGCKQHLDSLTMLRFLRARKFDVEAAKKMFLESEEWRNKLTVWDPEKGVNRLMSLHDKEPAANPPENPLKLDELVRTWDKDGSFKRQLSEFYKQFYHKTDKDGRPCYFEKLGGVDFKALRDKDYTNDKMLLNLAVEYEKMVDPRLPACSRRAGHLLETSCTVMDVAGVSLFSPGQIYEYIKQASAMSNNNYPERLGKMYVINAGWIVTNAWKFVKSFLDPVTASKIQVLGSSYKKTLLEQIPEDSLPAIYGGKCQCPGGCELSDAGPWQEPEWAEPAWWEKEETIENKPADIEAGADVAAEGEAVTDEAPVAGEAKAVA
ncbi:CRAL-TRIO domain-containing protein [Xylariaceae sp. FL0255]|nr:CRAL-TRIO domain-containing protein [Xylariaceae sp. FL0255]